MRASTPAPATTTTYSPLQSAMAHLVCHLHTSQPPPTPPDAGGPKVTMSEVYWARGRTEMGSVPASEPSQSRLSLRREREGLLKDCPEGSRGRGLPGTGPHPDSGATSSPRLCPAGGRTRAWRAAGTRPQEAGQRLSSGADAASSGTAARGRLSPNPAPPVPARVAAQP